MVEEGEGDCAETAVARSCSPPSPSAAAQDGGVSGGTTTWEEEPVMDAAEKDFVMGSSGEKQHQLAKQAADDAADDERVMENEYLFYISCLSKEV